MIIISSHSIGLPDHNEHELELENENENTGMIDKHLYYYFIKFVGINFMP